MIPGIQEIKALAIKYSKKQLANMAQTGLIDPQKAVMAGMMRDRIAKEDMQPPSTTVAQDVLGMGPQAQPQMGMQPPMGQPQGQMPPQQAPAGVESLPAGGVGNYAGGGIVAFDDGGSVPGYAGDDGSFVNYGFFGHGSGIPEYFSRPTMPYGEQMGNVGSAFINGLRRIVGDPSIDAKDRAAAKAKLAEIEKNTPTAPTTTAPTTTTSPTTTTTPTTTTRTLPAPPRRDAAPRAQGPGTSAPSVSALKRPEITLPDLSGLKPEAFKTRAAQDLPTIGKERTEYLRSMGVDPDMYGKMIEKEEGKRKDLQGRKDVAKGEALMEAGLGLIGARRGQEFQALGESGRRGLAGLREAGKELRAAEEKLDDRINSFRMADQQFKQTGAEKDLARRDADLARVEAAERDAVKERNQFATKRAELGMEGAKVRTQGEISLYDADLRASLEKEKIAVQRQQAANQASYYNKSLALTEARIKSMDTATQARLGKLKMDAGKMWENSQEKFNLEKQLKSQYGDNFMNVPKAQITIKQAQGAYIGQYLDQNDALIHAAPDQSTF